MFDVPARIHFLHKRPNFRVSPDDDRPANEISPPEFAMKSLRLPLHRRARDWCLYTMDRWCGILHLRRDRRPYARAIVIWLAIMVPWVIAGLASRYL